MSANNPDITVANVIENVETRLGDTNLDSMAYLPWTSYAYQKTYQAICAAGQQAKEYFFGDSTTFNLTADTSTYSLETNIPRFGGFIKVEIKYGGTGDTWVRAEKLKSVSHWDIQENVTTTNRSKTNPLYYKLGDTLGFIPQPPSSDSGTPQAKVFYIKRPYQLTDTTDVIDLPYRYIYPIEDYVHSKAIITENEDFGQASLVEQDFALQLKMITSIVTDEFNENDGTSSIEIDTNSSVYRNPLTRAW